MIYLLNLFLLGTNFRKFLNIFDNFYLPARFDWSIIGCTILRLALINLKLIKKLVKDFFFYMYICM